MAAAVLVTLVCRWNNAAAKRTKRTDEVDSMFTDSEWFFLAFCAKACQRPGLEKKMLDGYSGPRCRASTSPGGPGTPAGSTGDLSGRPRRPSAGPMCARLRVSNLRRGEGVN